MPPFELNAFWISQLLIFIGFIFDLASFQFKNKKHILICFATTAILISIHFVLLDEILAATLLAIGALRFVVSIFSQNKNIKWIFYALFTASAVWQYQVPLDIVPWICMIIFTTAAFQSNDKKLRLTMMVGTSLWITYNIIIAKSPALILMEISFLGSNLVGYYRHYLSSKQKSEHHTSE